ncbi:cytochrome o ubiquinol oxidase subunit IV [Microvirga terrae]|uniref:Cytochrome bo(3) ubiquinol oxidase subunit 4 n=1 Tax=Microvirga terrae TaxID=2740529 RepID=A0ABY5RSV6_9HYPH|nr:MULTISPECIES: cytochrome o ubiquinol oxidase subunit IV [Microvirga]MBQ0821711.1 cytochrome o ubiquinol oxidase subunit IV [Microvirga sp. HBU67558]UVF18877.1 cytochrome o ubiquinol oxidase subunit IV [Microvirga terrae]
MSQVAEPGTTRQSQGQSEVHGEHHSHGAQGTFRSYMTGFILSLILTAIPFWLVMGDVLGDTRTTSIIIIVLAAAQIVVHMIYFLHMNTKSEGGWTFLALLFTLILVVITLVGSIWVMYHMDQNMMPMSPHEALQRP